MLYIYIQNRDFYSQIKYVFDNIFFNLGIDYEYINNVSDIKRVYLNDIFIGYLESFSERCTLSNYFLNQLFIQNSRKLFGNTYFKSDSIPMEIKKYYGIRRMNDTDNIISIFNPDEKLYGTRTVFKGYQIFRTNIDIISDIFFMLTRYEEVVNSKLSDGEMYNRFPGKESVAYKHNFVNRPVVNEDIELIWSWIRDFKLGYSRKKWWHGSEFAVCISHDVDMIRKYRTIRNIVRSTLELLKKKQYKKMFLNFGIYLKSRINYYEDPYWTFDYILDKEQKSDIKSSFYFMSGGTSEFDNKYRINSRITKDLIKHLEGSGAEVGYHASFNSYNDYKLMEKEKRRMDNAAANKTYGCRQHYLRFEAPLTWRIQESLGLLYDTTLGYAEFIGFRCGTCFPFKPYDIIENRVINLWEIPLLIMDVSMFNENYSGYGTEEAFAKSEMIIEKVRQYSGVFSLLWHNSSIDSYDYYEKIMKYIGQSDCCRVDGRSLINLISSSNY